MRSTTSHLKGMFKVHYEYSTPHKGPDFMRENSSLLPLLGVSKTCHIWKYFFIIWLKKYPVDKRTESQLDIAFNCFFGF